MPGLFCLAFELIRYSLLLSLCIAYPKYMRACCHYRGSLVLLADVGTVVLGRESTRLDPVLVNEAVLRCVETFNNPLILSITSIQSTLILSESFHNLKYHITMG